MSRRRIDRRPAIQRPSRREGDPGRGGLQGTRPRAGQLGGPASRGLSPELMTKRRVGCGLCCVYNQPEGWMCHRMFHQEALGVAEERGIEKVNRREVEEGHGGGDEDPVERPRHRAGARPEVH
eukprot:1196357-Prorocentrum_minimum.AAC.1